MVAALLTLFIISVLFSVYYALTKKQDYWKKRNVPFVKLSLLFGNYREYILLKQYAPQITSEICKRFPNEPYIGTFYATEPALIVKDLDLIKQILIKDFFYFNGREISNYTHKEKLGNSFNFVAGDKWKVLRTNLTPLFSSSKTKSMFPLIQDCVTELEEYLKAKTKISQNFNIKSVLGKYTMNCIMSCAFGLNANTLKNDGADNPFVVIGEKMFDMSTVYKIKLIFRLMWPSLFYRIGFKLFDEKIGSFFDKLYNEVFENRQKTGLRRNDFVDFMLEWKKQNHISCESFRSHGTGEKKMFKIPVNNDLLVAQTVAIFGGGFETSSIAKTFLLYHLAKNKHVQDRVIDEVDSYFQRHGGVLDYECVNEMPYLEACLEEIFRLYPAVGILAREVMENYTLPTGLRLEKETRIHIPLYHLGGDPDYFPEPEVFRPERFLDKEKIKIKPFSFLPFGEGPRICIGRQFAKMTMHAGLLTLFKNCRVEPAYNTP